MVIADFPPGRFLDRCGLLAALNDTPAPIQALGYTPAEFRRMLDERSVTALDAVAQGIPLYGEEFFAGLREWLREQQAAGLVRERSGWRWP